MRIEVMTRIIRWGEVYALVPSDGDALKGLIDKTVRLTLVSDIGVYILSVKIRANPQYGVAIYLPRRMAPTWERLHEKALKAVIEVVNNDFL